MKDAEIINYHPKPLGSTELFPLSIKLSPNGKYFAIVSEKEFVVSTTSVYRSTCVGNGTDLAWNEGSDFAVKDGNVVRIYKEFKEFKSFKPGFSFDAIYGGAYLTVKTSDAIFIYDFDTQTLLRKIDVSANNIIWNENKKNVALICDDVTYILKINQEKIN